MNAGVIVAGGKGSRFGGYKQTTRLNNKPIYQYSVDVFNSSDAIDIIYLVIPEDLFPKIMKDLSNLHSSKSIILCEGGKTRSDSVYNAIKKIKEKENGKITDDALKLIVKISEGSVRDALSLLDRALISLDDKTELDLRTAQKFFGEWESKNPRGWRPDEPQDASDLQHSFRKFAADFLFYSSKPSRKALSQFLHL